MVLVPEQRERSDTHQQLQSFIDSGGYAAGDRLPAERELMDSLGVSRSALRKGLDALERDGIIWRHVGKGTFITSHDNHDKVPGLDRISQAITPVQMMRARLSLEPAIAREAAANASADAMSAIVEARDRSLSASSWDAYESNDDAFHRSLAQATGNVLLESLYQHLNQVHRAVAWGQVIRNSEKPPADHPSFKEHDLILAAVDARDPVAAHTRMREHLNSVSARCFGEH